MRRRLLISVCAAAVVAGVMTPSQAAAQQSINFYLGGFVPHDLGDRGADDVLLNNGSTLLFDFRDFRGVTAGGEYLVGLGDFFDGGLGIGIYSRTAFAVDRDFVQPDGSEIEADLKLRIVPITATVRYLPLGHHDAIVPYIGGGVGIYNWRYTETGDFVTANGDITHGAFAGTGTTVGPVILGGVRVPIGRRGSGIGGEVRYQRGRGDLPSDQGFAGGKIDLGGFNYLFTVNVGF